MKWEPPALMALVMALGVWLVVGTGNRLNYADTREGATVFELRIGTFRGLLEAAPDTPEAGAGETTFRILRRDGSASGTFSRAELDTMLGSDEVDRMLGLEANWLFRVFNITTWSGLIWVAIGLGGQVAFFGRMAIQWIASERSRASVIPSAFWYLSLIGGVCLFTYFVWRKDIVGVLGQTTGIVIYARNIRLIGKQKRRAARSAAREAEAESAREPEPAANA